ncbi:DUF2806 domain-containing protein [Pseudorhodoferax sp. Leaf267]|uniref:DUF2806 domain-containing protein n=1 Tax=Pseudorhodoferax sp. Leaf267 TaxID=1736316 RepID=UPI0009EBD196|nr:DUF2806 domain-containing protein [Pseudorhodoferax sp. Leaf267]
MTDNLGLGKAAEKIVGAISSGIGVLYKPRAIRAEADARAYERIVIGQADLHIEKKRAVQQISLDIDHVRQHDDLTYALASRARDRLVASEIQRQANVEAIAELALQDIPAEVSDSDVDSDWTRTLFRYGQEVSNESMQRLWAKIIQAEVVKPDSFSLRTLQTLSTLRASDLETFKVLCSLCDEHRKIICPPPVEGHLELESLNYLESHGLPYEKIRQLRELGLLGQVEPFMSISINRQITGNNPVYRMKIPSGGTATLNREITNQSEFVFYCYRLTLAGEELSRLANSEFNWRYLEAVARFYKTFLTVEANSANA